ncbi:immunoglobulin superfamily member 1-like [Sarcophilus harrisii]
MDPDLLCLLCLGLCCICMITAQLASPPRPTLYVQPGPVGAPGEEVTFRCRRPSSSYTRLVTFALLKAGTQKPLQMYHGNFSETNFPLKSLRAQDSGSYSCVYYYTSHPHVRSEASETLEVWVTASPPRPTLHAEPGPVVAPGEEVTFRCRSPSSSPNRLVTFLLLKAGTQEPLQKNQETLSETNFTLKSPSAQDSGSYSCVYYYTSHPHVRSEASETLELWVTDSLPKPSLSARPSSRVTPEDNVTLLCQGPSRGVRFALYKDGEKLPVSTSEPTQHWAEFPLIHVNINQTGEYRCSYLLGRDSPVLALPSDPLELTIQDSTQSFYFVINLFRISLVGLVLLVMGKLLASEWNGLRS